MLFYFRNCLLKTFFFFINFSAYFKHPRLVCNPGARDAKPYKGLYIQMGDDPERDYMEIPLKLKDLSSDWKEAGCVTKMGKHGFFFSIIF